MPKRVLLAGRGSEPGLSTLAESRGFHLEIGAETRSPLEQLAAASGLSRAQVKRAMQKGAVWVQQGRRVRRLRRAKAEFPAGAELHFYFDPAVLAQEPPPARLIADEGHYSVWFKPAGMWSQGSKWGDHCTLYRWAERRLRPERPAFIVHRLDRAARGLCLLAHSRTAAARLSALFAERGVEKRYRALVHGRFPGTSEPLSIEEPVEGRRACSCVRLLDYSADLDRSWLEVEIETGRKHQIRRHLAGLGYPIVGDRLYGRSGDREDLQLIAWRLAFACPFTGEVRSYSLSADP